MRIHYICQVTHENTVNAIPLIHYASKEKTENIQVSLIYNQDVYDHYESLKKFAATLTHNKVIEIKQPRSYHNPPDDLLDKISSVYKLETDMTIINIGGGQKTHTYGMMKIIADHLQDEKHEFKTIYPDGKNGKLLTYNHSARLWESDDNINIAPNLVNIGKFSLLYDVECLIKQEEQDALYTRPNLYQWPLFRKAVHHANRYDINEKTYADLIKNWYSEKNWSLDKFVDRELKSEIKLKINPLFKLVRDFAAKRFAIVITSTDMEENPRRTSDTEYGKKFYSAVEGRLNYNEKHLPMDVIKMLLGKQSINSYKDKIFINIADKSTRKINNFKTNNGRKLGPGNYFELMMQQLVKDYCDRHENKNIIDYQYNVRLFNNSVDVINLSEFDIMMLSKSGHQMIIEVKAFEFDKKDYQSRKFVQKKFFGSFIRYVALVYFPIGDIYPKQADEIVDAEYEPYCNNIYNYEKHIDEYYIYDPMAAKAKSHYLIKIRGQYENHEGKIKPKYRFALRMHQVTMKKITIVGEEWTVLNCLVIKNQYDLMQAISDL